MGENKMHTVTEVKVIDAVFYRDIFLGGGVSLSFFSSYFDSTFL
jgi:hypothetical protein